MTDAKRDDNRVPTLIGVDSSGVPQNAQIDNATGRLLINIQHVSSIPTPVTPTEVRDNNRVPAAYGVDGSGDPQSVLIDNRNNGILADVTIE